MAQHVLIALLASSLLPGTAFAASFNVNSSLDLIDDSPGDGLCRAASAGNPCTLRAAIMEANANAEADVVYLPPGIDIALTLAGDGGAEVGDLDIRSAIDIRGFDGAPPADPTLIPRIDATAINDRHFYVLDGQLRLRGLRLEGGNTAVSGGALQVSGGAVSSARVEHVLFARNRAGSRGGAINVVGLASAEVEDSHFLLNRAGSGSGAAIATSSSSEFVLRRSSLLDNRSEGGISASFQLVGNALARIENSTFDGSPQAPLTAGIEARQGISMGFAAELVLRNTTISGFADNAVRMGDIDGNERVVIANSVLQSNGIACSAGGTDLAAGNVQISASIVQNTNACQPFYLEGVRPGIAELGALVSDAPRLTQSRPPSGPLSNVVDRGWPSDVPASDPDFLCTATDQRGNPRGLDGNLDGEARCDLGAIEEAPPEPFVVNHFSTDLSDDLPGDGVCASVPQAGIGAVCTLRAAIMEANALPGLDYIRFAPSSLPVQLTLAPAGPVGGTLNITEAVAIEGNLEDGRPATFIEGSMPDQGLFSVQADGDAVHLRNLDLTGGDAFAAGGALRVSAGQVTLSRSELRANASEVGGGAVAVLGGVLLIHDSAFVGNASPNNGAAAYVNDGYLAVSGSSFHGHLGIRPDGSPIPTVQTTPNARLQIANSTFSGNQRAIQSDMPDLLILLFVTLADQLNGGLNVVLQTGSDLFVVGSIIAAPDSAQFDCAISGLELAGDAVFDQLLDSDGSCAALTPNGLTAPAQLLPLDRPDGQVSFRRLPDATPGGASPALDRAPDLSCLNARDQHGRVRPVDLPAVANGGGACDLGAIERAGDALFSDGFESAP
jgi:predicted outer membrane repeat protein